MAVAPVPPADNVDQNGGQSIITTIMQMFVVYSALSWLIKPTALKVDEKGVAIPPHGNLWRDGQAFDIYVYASAYKQVEMDLEMDEKLIWQQSIVYYDWNEENNRAQNVSIEVSDHLLRNGSMYAHVFFVKHGVDFDVKKGCSDPTALIYANVDLVVYRPKPKINVKKNLISGQYADERVHSELQNVEVGEEHKRIAELKKTPVEIVSFFKPSLSLRLLHDFSVFGRGTIPPQISKHFIFDKSGNTANYYPVAYIDDFWVRTEHLIQINSSISEINFEISYSPISMWKWQMQLSMEESWKMQSEWGAHAEGDTDEIKRLLAETDPWLLGLTVIISILHSVFDFLAFKNDISFWRSNESVEGISVRTIFVNAFSQFIILLYLFDNDTSWMILLSSVVGLGIELWKISRAADVTITWSGNIPISIKIQEKDSYTKTLTQQYDKEAMTYMSYIFYPLALGYAIYSLMYNEHKSYYSFVVSTMVSFIYTFGFIMMCPQLYLNYKLKSVAHLPWKMLTYKFINTFIDDLFAFIIKMPTMHRLSCFRDDIIFFIYLYQRWAYPVDYKRTNEFGLTPLTETLTDAAKSDPPVEEIEQKKEVEIGSELEHVDKEMPKPEKESSSLTETIKRE